MLSETDSYLWRERREPLKQVVLMLLEACAETGSCLSTPSWRKAILVSGATKKQTPRVEWASIFLHDYTQVFSLTAKNPPLYLWIIQAGERKYWWKDTGVHTPYLKSLRQGMFWNSNVFTFKNGNPKHKYYIAPQLCLDQHPQSNRATFLQENIWILNKWNKNHKGPAVNLSQVLLPRL